MWCLRSSGQPRGGPRPTRTARRPSNTLNELSFPSHGDAQAAYKLTGKVSGGSPDGDTVLVESNGVLMMLGGFGTITIRVSHPMDVTELTQIVDTAGGKVNAVEPPLLGLGRPSPLPPLLVRVVPLRIVDGLPIQHSHRADVQGVTFRTDIGEPPGETAHGASVRGS